MLMRVLRYIEKENMLAAGDKVIVGVSGGADSVCLLFMLRELREKLGIDLAAVHVEHGLRGEASREDAYFTEALCREWGIPFRQFSYQVGHIAEEEKLSIEEAGRKVRYESFRRAAEESGYNKIAVAHNKDDNAETVLMNLFRGTGLRGLGGILPVREAVVRPLLCLERKDIEIFLKEHQIDFCTDESNAENHYTRNRVRNHILSYAKESINPDVNENIWKSSEIMREAESFLVGEVQKVKENVLKEDAAGILINGTEFQKLHIFLKKQIVMLCFEKLMQGRKNVTHKHIEAVSDLAGMQVGRQTDLPYGYKAVKTYDGVFLQKKSVQEADIREAVQIGVPGIVKWGEVTLSAEILIWKKHGIIPEKKCTKWFDYDIIKGNLQLRTRMQGDYLIVNKAGGRKKLKSYFIDEKIPREKRDEILLLASGSYVLWVIGYRISEDCKVTEDTKQVLKVQIDGGELHGR